MCVFKHLALYQGELLYIVDDQDEVEAVTMPNPTVFDLEAETLSIVDYAVPNIVHPITLDALKLRIKSSTRKRRSAWHATSRRCSSASDPSPIGTGP